MADKDPLDLKDADPAIPPAPAGKRGNPNRGAGGRFAPSPDGPKRQRSPKPRGAKLTDAQLRDKATQLLAGIGMAVYWRDQVCGPAIMQGAPELADALVELSKENDQVRRALESLAVTSSWGAVLVATAKIGVTIAAHHKLLPENVANAVQVATGQAPAPHLEQSAPPQPAQEQPARGGPERYPPAEEPPEGTVVTAEQVTA
jgi:hypothetical protein